MDMLFFNLCILIFFIGIIEAAVIRDSFKDEGGGSSKSNHATEDSMSRIHSEKQIHFEYPLEKPYPGNEYIKISILSKSKLPNPLPDPRVLWNRTIPFIIYNRSSPKEKALILSVIKWFNTKTCMTFVEGNSHETFIIVTPRSWLTHSLCRTKEHKRNLRKIGQGIFYDMKFVLDFGLNGKDDKEITKDGTSVNLSTEKLNDFYSCDIDDFLLQSRHNTTWIHSRKKRSLKNINDNDGNFTSLAPDIPETSGFDESFSMKNMEEEIIAILSRPLAEEPEEPLEDDDILLTVTKPTKVGYNTITLPPTHNKSETIDDSILFRRNEKSTNDISDKSTIVTEAISMDRELPSSTVSVEEAGVAIKEPTTSRSRESTADSGISSMEAISTDKELPSSTVSAEEAGVAIKEATTSRSRESTANSPIPSMAINDDKTSDDINVPSEGNDNTSAVTQTVNMRSMFRSGDIVATKDPYGNVKVVTSSPASRKLGLGNGGKEVILSDSKVVVVDEHSVQEHEIGTEHQHLHGRSGTLKDDEDEEHDGFHKVDVIDGNPIQGRTALKDPTKLWTDGIIPYVLSDKYDNRQKQLVIEGMEEFHNKTCVRFVKRTNEKSYMFLQPDSRCSATIGKIKDGVNNVTISDGCFVPGIIVHELMHVMGFIHEQNRPDRDSYVMIVWNNVLPKARGNFRKYRKGDVQDFGQGYDYDSVMHYGMYDFAINFERPTIIPLQPGTNIGQRDGFSKKDLFKVNKLFKCDEAAEDDDGEIEFRRRPRAKPRNDFKKKFLLYLKKIFKALFVSLQTFARVEI